MLFSSGMFSRLPFIYLSKTPHLTDHVYSLLFCLTLSVMDSSAVSTALMSIGDHFNDTMNIQWVVLSYILSDLGMKFFNNL